SRRVRPSFPTRRSSDLGRVSYLARLALDEREHLPLFVGELGAGLERWLQRRLLFRRLSDRARRFGAFLGGPRAHRRLRSLHVCRSEEHTSELPSRENLV